MNERRRVMSAYDLRKTARENLKGFWLRLTLAMFFCTVIGMYSGASSFQSMLTTERLGQTATLTVEHTSGFSWSGTAETTAARAVVEAMQSAISGDFDSAGSVPFRDLLASLPESFWAFFGTAIAVSAVVPMLNFGMTCILRRRILGEDFSYKTLLQWHMLPKTLAASLLTTTLPALMTIIAGFASGALLLILALPMLILCILIPFMYAMTYYMWACDPHLGVIEALRASRLCMRGHKARYFGFGLTYLGWILMSGAPAFVASALGVSSPLLAILFQLLFSAPVILYLRMGEVTFFHDLKNAPVEEASEEAPVYEDGEWENVPDAQPGSSFVRSADEAAAQDMLFSYKCSRKAMMREGVWEEYTALHIPPAVQLSWMKHYIENLCARFEEDPSLLEDVLLYGAEYGDTYSVSRVVEILDRDLNEEQQSPAELLPQCIRVAAVLNCPAFDGRRKFVAEGKERLADMADRMEYRLQSVDPNGAWREMLAGLRVACLEK